MKNNLKVAVAELMLGYTRVQGVVVYNSLSKEFNEITPAEAKKLIDKKELLGILYEKSEDGIKFICDTDGFSQTDLLIKTACGKYRSMNNDVVGNTVLNSIYTVVKKYEYNDKNFYEIVGTKCSRLTIAEENLIELNNISHVAGCWIQDEEIRLHEDIPIIKRDTSYNSNILEVDTNISSNNDADEETLEESPSTDIVEALLNDKEDIPSLEDVESDTPAEEILEELSYTDTSKDKEESTMTALFESAKAQLKKKGKKSFKK